MWDKVVKFLIFLLMFRISNALDYDLRDHCGPMESNSVICVDINIDDDYDEIKESYPSHYMHNLTIRHSNIRKLGKFSIRKLQYLSMKSCQIEEITAETFSSITDLTRLNLDQNKLKTLPANAFSGLSSLEYLSIRNNLLTQIDRTQFNGLRNLRILDLRHNQIEKLPENVFQELQSLRELYLSNNTIVTIESSAFVNGFNLQILYLQNNLLEDIQTGTFKTLNYIIELNLANNKIKRLAENALPEINNLKLLNLSYNQLKNLEYNKYEGEILDLSHNLIETIDHNAFKTSEQLLVLNMSNNHLNNIEFNMFFGLHKLKTLDMSRNNITKLYSESFILLQKIQSLDLSWNNITVIENDIFESNIELSDLNLAHNQVQNIEFMESLCNIVRLNLSTALGDEIDGSRILQILAKGQRCIKQMHQMSRLKSVDLTYNQLEQADLGFFQGLKNVEYIYLEGNNLTELNFQSWEEDQLAKLIEIGIQQNEWNCTYLSTMIRFLLRRNIRIRSRNSFSTTFTSHRGGIACVDCTPEKASLRSCQTAPPQTPTVPNTPTPSISTQRIRTTHTSIFHHPTNSIIHSTSPIPHAVTDNSAHGMDDQENEKSDFQNSLNEAEKDDSTGSTSSSAYILITILALSVILNVGLGVKIIYTLRRRNPNSYRDGETAIYNVDNCNECVEDL